MTEAKRTDFLYPNGKYSIEARDLKPKSVESFDDNMINNQRIVIGEEGTIREFVKEGHGDQGGNEEYDVSELKQARDELIG